MDDITLYYFFSTIAQTYGAIIGLIGMLTVYKLQRIETNISQQYNDKKKSIKQSSGTNPDFYQMEEFSSIWEKTKQGFVPEETGWNPCHHDFQDFVIFLDHTLHIKKLSQDRFIHFLILNAFIIFISLVLLLFCQPLSTSGWKYFWSTIMISLVVFSLIATVRLCLTLTELKFDDYLKRLRINIKEHIDKWEQYVAKLLD